MTTENRTNRLRYGKLQQLPKKIEAKSSSSAKPKSKRKKKASGQLARDIIKILDTAIHYQQLMSEQLASVDGRQKSLHSKIVLQNTRDRIVKRLIEDWD